MIFSMNNCKNIQKRKFNMIPLKSESSEDVGNEQYNNLSLSQIMFQKKLIASQVTSPKNNINNLSQCCNDNKEVADKINEIYQSNQCQNSCIPSVKSNFQESMGKDIRENIVISTNFESLSFKPNKQLSKLQNIQFACFKQNNNQNKYNNKDQCQIKLKQNSSNQFKFHDIRQNSIQLDNYNCCSEFISQKLPCKIQNVYNFGKDQLQQSKLSDQINQFQQSKLSDQINQFQQSKLSDQIDQVDSDLKNNQQKKKKLNRKVLMKATKWTFEQTLKYIAYLSVHKDDFNKKKFLFDQCSEYATQGNTEKIRNRHYFFTSNDIKFTIDDIIYHIKSQQRISDQQLNQEILNLKQFKLKKFLKLLTKSNQNLSQPNKLLQNSVANSQLPKKNLILNFGQLNKYIKPQNLQYKIIPYKMNNEIKENNLKDNISILQIQQQQKQSRSQKQQISKSQRQQLKQCKEQRTKSRFMTNIQSDLQFDINEIAQELQKYKASLKNRSQNKSFQKSNNNLINYNLKNKINRSMIINRIYGVNNLNSSEENISKQLNIAKTTNSVQNSDNCIQKKNRPWTNQEQMKFLAFISVYQAAFSPNVGVKISKVMADYIQTRNYQVCNDRILYYAKKFKTVEQVKKQFLSKININPQNLQILINQLKTKAQNQRQIVYIQDRQKQIAANQKHSNLVQLVKEKIEQHNIQLRLSKNI